MNRHIPDWLYQALPYLYVMIGTLVLATVNHPIALFSSGLLIMAGLQVFAARMTHRIKKRDLGHYRRCEMAHTCPNRLG